MSRRRGRSGVRVARAGTLAAAAVVVLPAGAAVAVPLLTATQSETLQAQLQRAYDVQGICYGWELDVTDRSTATGNGRDVGSAPGGVGVPLDRAACPRYAVLRGSITYTAEFEEAEDSAAASVAAVGVPIDAADVGLDGRALAGDDGDLAAYAAIAALPAAAARSGAAPFVPVAEDVLAAPPSDDPLDVEAGNDALRERSALVALLGIGVVAGLGWLVVEALRPRFAGALGGAAGPGLRGPHVGFVGPGGARAPGGHPLARVQPGDVVTLAGRDWQVRGTLLFDEDGYRWAEHLLDDVASKRWLSVDPNRGFDVALWEAVPTADVEGAPPSPQLRVRGVPVQRVEAGRAHMTAFGTTGTTPSGTAEYVDYRGPAGERAAAERYGTGSWEVAVGTPVDPTSVVVHAAPATTGGSSAP